VIEDFWFGVIVTIAVGLGIIVLAGGAVLTWLFGWLSKYASIGLTKDVKGAVKVEADVRAK